MSAEQPIEQSDKDKIILKSKSLTRIPCIANPQIFRKCLGKSQMTHCYCLFSQLLT